MVKINILFFLILISVDGYAQERNREDTIYYYLDGKKVQGYPSKKFDSSAFQVDTNYFHNKSLPHDHLDSVNCPMAYDSVLKRTFYTYADSMPEYPGGMTELLMFFSRNFKYPKEQAEDFQASIFLTFVVETDGRLSNIQTTNKLRTNMTLVDKEAIRVFKLMPSWKPGKCDGREVAMKVNLPIRF